MDALNAKTSIYKGVVETVLAEYCVILVGPPLPSAGRACPVSVPSPMRRLNHAHKEPESRRRGADCCDCGKRQYPKEPGMFPRCCLTGSDFRLVQMRLLALCSWALGQVWNRTWISHFTRVVERQIVSVANRQAFALSWRTRQGESVRATVLLVVAIVLAVPIVVGAYYALGVVLRLAAGHAP